MPQTIQSVYCVRQALTRRSAQPFAPHPDEPPLPPVPAGAPALTTAEFAEALSRLVGEAEDAGLERPQLIAAGTGRLEDQAQAMREAEEE
jgi:hypothetical protein